MSPLLANHLHGSIGIRGGAGLADGNDQGIGHTFGIVWISEIESAEFRSLQCTDMSGWIIKIGVEYVGTCKGRDTGRALTDEKYSPDLTLSQRRLKSLRNRLLIKDNPVMMGRVRTDFPSILQGFFHGCGCFGNLFEKIMGIVLTIDVS